MSVTNIVERETTGRLAGVDGLRAFAALWVVLFHMRAFSGAIIHLVPGLDLFIRSGSTGVSLFLVLSGFCLYHPFAGGRLARFRTTRFLARRCSRLMPAYYVSLVLAMILVLVGGPALGFSSFSPGEAIWQAFTHLTLIHTLFPSTFYAVNGAYWSLGLEWQLYLALPILILIARRFGVLTSIGLAILCNVAYRTGLWILEQHGTIHAGTILADAVLPNLIFGRWAEFGYGMLAAELYASGRISAGATWFRWLRWSPVLLVPAGFVAVKFPLSHMIFGAVFFVLLLIVLAGNNPVAGLFSWRPLVAVGVMSYSLYLVHQPVVAAVAYVLRADTGLSPGATFVALVLLLPVILALAWILFQTVERRTLTSNRHTPLPIVSEAAITSGVSR